MPTMRAEQPTEDEISIAQNVFQLWQGGNQEGALQRLQPTADAGRAWALALISWLHMQRGAPAMFDGVRYAKKASEMGMPWAAVNLFNNLIANVGSDPSLFERAMELATVASPWSAGIDPVGQGWNLVAQGRVVDGVRLMSLHAPFPLTNDEWEGLTATAQSKLTEIDASVASARLSRDEVTRVALESVTAIDKARGDLETSANQAGLLVTTVVSDTTASLFKADADRNEEQSRAAWRWGLGVLTAAAIVAVTPLLIHYLGEGPNLSTGALLGAHAGSTAALATVAGVLLARGRSRDHARQRANDLSTAMGTMIAYSNQISDESERQRFMTTMGQLVLQAHLTTGSQTHGSDDSLTGLIALTNLVRAPGGQSVSTPS